jgi:hypothetical protein
VPAIQPARLRQQASLVSQHFSQPPALIRSLHYLFGYYAERSRHIGLAGKPVALSPAYKVPAPVLSYVLRELSPLASEDIPGGLKLCDALWGQDYLEFRTLACMLLGAVPISDPDLVLHRLRDWIKPDLEDRLIRELFVHGLAFLRRRNPQAILAQAERWLMGKESFSQMLGLQALLPLITEPGYENLPVFFRLIHPFCQVAPAALRPDLLDILDALARRSPKETAFFLRQSLNLPASPDTPWLIRQVLPNFPPDIQKDLRQTLRSLDSTTSIRK